MRQVAAILTSTGAPDADKLVRTGPNGRFDETVMPLGFGADIKVVEATEALSAGDLVNVYDNGGTEGVRKADGSASGKEADGYVKDSVSSGANATVYFEGLNDQLSGLTIGARYYLSASTPGAIVAIPPAGAGNVVQYVGRAVSDSELTFEADEGVILAS